MSDKWPGCWGGCVTEWPRGGARAKSGPSEHRLLEADVWVQTLRVPFQLLPHSLGSSEVGWAGSGAKERREKIRTHLRLMVKMDRDGSMQGDSNPEEEREPQALGMMLGEGCELQAQAGGVRGWSCWLQGPLGGTVAQWQVWPRWVHSHWNRSAALGPKSRNLWDRTEAE